MATATQWMEGDASAPQQIIVTYNTATLVCSQVQVVNNDTLPWHIEVTNANTHPATVLTQDVPAGTNRVIAMSGMTLQRVTGDDGTSALSWPVGWSVYARYPA